jgi:fimbrial chaperone protein
MKALRILIAAFVIVNAALDAGAFTLEPMSILIAPTGTGKIATFRIKNDGAERVAIRFSVLTRELGPNGKEQNAPADSFFMIYPSRLLVEPGATGITKVQWKGPASLDAERCFRFVADEVGVDAAPSAGSGIKMRFRYIAALYVGQGNFQPKLEASAEGVEGPGGVRGLSVRIDNSGARHVLAISPSLELSTEDGGQLLVSPEELGALNGANYLPGSSMSIFIPRDDAEVGKRYDAQLEYKSEY